MKRHTGFRTARINPAATSMALMCAAVFAQSGKPEKSNGLSPWLFFVWISSNKKPPEKAVSVR
jgi:hypothetical protein